MNEISSVPELRPGRPLFARVPRHLHVAGANWLARAVTIGVQLASIPLLIRSLGSDQYAAYTIALSMLGWFALADLGCGNTVQNLAAESRALSRAAAGEIGAVAVVSGVTFVLGILALVGVAPLMGDALLSGIPGLAPALRARVVMIAGSLFLLATTASVATKLLYGLGLGVHANVLAAGASLMSLLLLWLATRLFARSDLLLPAIVAYALPLALLGGIGASFLFWRHGAWGWRRLVESSRVVFKRARGFFLVALFAAGVLNVDYFIMSQSLAPDEITTYNFLSRCFGIALTLYAGLLSAAAVYWSECISRGDWDSVRRSQAHYVAYGLVAMATLTLAGLAGAQRLLNAMLPGTTVAISNSTILMFGAYMAIRVWTDTSTVALQAANETGVLIRWIPLQAVISILGQLGLVRLFGVGGIVAGLFLSFMLTVAWVLPSRLQRLARNIQRP